MMDTGKQINASAAPTIMGSNEFLRLAMAYRAAPDGGAAKAGEELVQSIDKWASIRAEEARREAAEQALTHYEGKIAELLSTRAAQRTAGGDVVAWRYRTTGGKHWQATTDAAVAGTMRGHANIEVRSLIDAVEPVAEAAAHAAPWEARRYCKGDAEWTGWTPMTQAEYERRKDDASFEFRAAPTAQPTPHMDTANLRELLRGLEAGEELMTLGTPEWFFKLDAAAQPTLPDDERAAKIDAALEKCQRVATESGAYESYRAVGEAFAELRAALRQPGALPDEARKPLKRLTEEAVGKLAREHLTVNVDGTWFSGYAADIDAFALAVMDEMDAIAAGCVAAKQAGKVQS